MGMLEFYKAISASFNQFAFGSIKTQTLDMGAKAEGETFGRESDFRESMIFGSSRKKFFALPHGVTNDDNPSKIRSNSRSNSPSNSRSLSLNSFLSFLTESKERKHVSNVNKK